MCVSLLLETEATRLGAALGVPTVVGGAPGDPARVESRGVATVLRIGAGGRLVGERMSFNPYVLRRSNVGGDLWAHALLGESHGLLVVRAFSEWASADRLIRSGMINPFDVNCAFNRFAAGASTPGIGPQPRDRMVLANFKPMSGRAMLVPVLFDTSRVKNADPPREFAVITQDPSDDLASMGVAHLPVGLTTEAAWAWLTAADASVPPAADGEGGSVDIDLDEVLEDERDEDLQFSLFKSA